MYQLYDYQQKLVSGARDALAKGNHGVLIVSPPGSGKSIVIARIAHLATNKGNHVMFFVHRKELVKQIIRTFKTERVNLDLCHIDTVIKTANHLKKLPKPSLIIIDEAHHARAKSYKKILNYFKNVPRLGFTATPWRLNGRGFDDIYSCMIAGPQVQWLIDHHFLADYSYISKKLGKDDLLKLSSTGDYTQESMEKYADSMNFGDMIKVFRQHAANRKTIVYTPTIASANLVEEKFHANGFNAIEVDSKTSKDKRGQIMKDFKTGKIQILVNVNLISEGFDVPDCSCVILLRPTQSLVLYLQQAMRCMRYRKGKQAVIIDHVGNFEQPEKFKVKYFDKHGDVHTRTEKIPFGFPREKRSWSLKARLKPTRGGSLPIKTCPECFAVIPAAKAICPQCGYEFPLQSKNHLNLNDKTEMSIIDSPKHHGNLFTTNYILTKKPSELKTVAELRTYQKAKNYKPGWIYYQEKQRGWV